MSRSTTKLENNIVATTAATDSVHSCSHNNVRFLLHFSFSDECGSRMLHFTVQSLPACDMSDCLLLPSGIVALSDNRCSKSGRGSNRAVVSPAKS